MDLNVDKDNLNNEVFLEIQNAFDADSHHRFLLQIWIHDVGGSPKETRYRSEWNFSLTWLN